MNREALSELKHQKEVHEMRKEEWTSQEEHRDGAQACRDGAEKAKAHLELRSAGNVKGKTKAFFKYISSKMKAEENYLRGV